jgi:hypothetical protein
MLSVLPEQIEDELREKMVRKIVIKCRDFEVEAELLEKKSPKTCDAIWRALPFEAEVEIWKEEVYFEIPIKIPPENPTPKTTAGDVSYWPEGPGFCIFFGHSQPISPVNTFARIKDGVKKFRTARTGDRITVRRA